MIIDQFYLGKFVGKIVKLNKILRGWKKRKEKRIYFLKKKNK